MWDGLAVLAQPSQVELDGPPHLVQDVLFGIRQRHATGQIRAPRTVLAIIGPLDATA